MIYSLADIIANDIHHHNTHSRLITVLSGPAEVALADMISFIDHAYAVSAAVASTRGYTFRRKVKSGTGHEVLMTNASIRTDAVTILAASFANRFAEAGSLHGITVIADAKSGCDAPAVNAGPRLADRLTGILEITKVSVTGHALADFRRHAGAHYAALAADWFTHARVHRLVTLVAGADTGRCAPAENATVVAFRLAGKARIRLVRRVTILATAQVGSYAATISARTIADRFACEMRNILDVLVNLGSYVTGKTGADIRLGAVSAI